MKAKVLKRAVALLLACLMTVTLTACSKTLKGTYVTKDALVEQSLTFGDDNKVSMSAFGLAVEGTYAIEKDTLIITYSVLGLSYSWENSFQKDGSSIFIDGVEFVKEK